METDIITLLLLAISILPFNAFAQKNHKDSTSEKIEWHEIIGKENHFMEKGHLETELEMYPFNVVVPNDPVIKNEAMFDYHRFVKEDRLVNARFFADANTHWKGLRNMTDLIMYTEFIYGFKHFQIGAEVGSVSGEEYISVGPQYTAYNNRFFKRISIISRVFPDLAFGYEYTTKELEIFKGALLSSTGTSRVVLPKNQMIIQLSSWLSFEKWRGIYVGLEYEHNNAIYYNDVKLETPNELFLGIKFELH